MKRLKEVSLKEQLISLIIAAMVFVMMGTLTALWNNPYFVRMTPVTDWDFLILSLESILIGLFFGIRTPRCATKKAGIGGVFGFLGFGCSICNKLLLLLFGSSFLLTYFEPIRYYVGAAGILIFSFALYQKMALPLLQPAKIKTEV